MVAESRKRKAITTLKRLVWRGAIYHRMRLKALSFFLSPHSAPSGSRVVEAKRGRKEGAELTMIRVGGCQRFTYVFISQKRLQHEKYRISAISSHDIGDSHVFYILFLRLSGILNCWLSPVIVSQRHFKELTNASSPLTFDKDIFGCP